MLTKGKISAIYENAISVILPEYDNAVTPPIPVYGGSKAVNEYEVNELVLIAFFNNDLNDSIVLGK